MAAKAPSAQVAYRARPLNAWGANPAAANQRPLNAWGPAKVTPGYTPPPTPTAPVPGPAAPVEPVAAAPPTDPTAKYKDSSYYAAVAQNLATRTSGLAQLGEADTRLKQDNGTAMERLARSYAGQRQNLSEGANKQGLFFSGILGKRLGDAEQVYNDQTGDAGKTLSRGLFDNQAQRGSLLKQYGDPADANDYGLSGGSLLAEAGQRYTANNPVPPTVVGRPGENGLPQGFNSGGWNGLGAGYTVEWDTATGKAKRIIKL